MPVHCAVSRPAHPVDTQTERLARCAEKFSSGEGSAGTLLGLCGLDGVTPNEGL
jgi:hypothetical protein